MATVFKRWPYALNQPGYDYPAEYFRAQHFDATSGGNGVSSPAACKVVAQQAPDGTVLILPGGATAVSTYAGAENQSYQMTVFQPIAFEIPPTGSGSGGRHDLLVLRVSDPQYGDYPPGAPRRELTAEEAAEYDFWYPHLIQGTNANPNLDYPHVRLAHIRRNPNTTVVTDDDIVDIRKLAAPKTWLHMRANNLNMADAQSLHTGTSVWPTEATHTVRIPEFATRVQIHAAWGTVHTHRQASDHGPASGQVTVALVLPGDSTITTQQSTWRTDPGQGYNRFSIVLGDNRPIPERFRGQEVRVELRGNKTYGPNVYMDGDSSWTVQLYFEQEIQ